jgi:hypothetical protein
MHEVFQETCHLYSDVDGPQGRINGILHHDLLSVNQLTGSLKQLERLYWTEKVGRSHRLRLFSQQVGRPLQAQRVCNTCTWVDLSTPTFAPSCTAFTSSEAVSCPARGICIKATQSTNRRTCSITPWAFTHATVEARVGKVTPLMVTLKASDWSCNSFTFDSKSLTVSWRSGGKMVAGGLAGGPAPLAGLDAPSGPGAPRPKSDWQS